MEHHPSSTAPHSIGLSQSFPGMPQAAPAPPPPVLLQGQQPPIQGQQPYHHLLQQQQQQLHSFWAYQMQEIEQVSDFKTHQLPLARIKKIMKADEDVRMISAEAPVLFAKACEMFILELTLRSWIHAEENKRRTLQRNDIAAAITRTDIFDFLVDIVPRDELKEEGLGLARGGLPEVSYFYPPIHQPQQGIMGSPSIMMGRPAMQMDPSLYMQQPRAVSMPYSMPPHQPVQQVWQQQQQHQQQVPDGQPYGHPHQQQMPDGQSYGQHLPDGHSYGAPPPPPPPPAT